MSKLMRWTMGVVWPLCFFVVVAVGAEIHEADQPSKLKTYRDVDGQSYFALNLRPNVDEPSLPRRDVLILVDTSASQAGLFRDGSLEAVDTMVRGLRDDERINIMAIDLKAVPMTDGFAKHGSSRLDEGLSKLKARTPLGATDLVAGIRQASAEFEDSARQRVIVYIGDGISRANVPAFDEFEPLVQELVKQRISVSSYAIGLHHDIEMLAVLANNTGGSVFVDGPEFSAQQAGEQMLSIARGTVLWPSQVSWPDALSEIYPVHMPPLRFDRDSVVIGTFAGKGAQVLRLEANAAEGQTVTLSWTLAPEDTTEFDDYAMLPQLVASARATDGLTLPLLGSEGLDMARRLFQLTSENLSHLGKQALTRGDTEGAMQLIKEALRRDPGNVEARALLKATSQRSTKTKGIQQRAPAIRYTQLPDVPTVVPEEVLRSVEGQPLVLGGEAVDDDASLLQGAAEDRELQAQIIRAEVTQGLSSARDLMRQDPDSAIANLKNLHESVVQVSALEQGVRAELLDRLELGLRQASRRRIEKERMDAVERANLAAVEASQRLREADARMGDKMRSYLGQINALLDEGRYSLAEEVALQARDEAPDMIEPTVALAKATAIGNYSKMRALLELKGRRMLDALYEVEKSAIPFPDDPPIEYPDAETWGEMTERRKARYSQFDLAQTGQAEQKITSELRKDTKLEFNDTPLTDVIDYLSQLHGIPILLDTRALEDASIDATSDTVNINLPKITLKSGLRHILEPLDLGYIIDNEVLKITSREVADETLVTKVYPVGDLVMPIMSMGGGMGGMMGGGMMGGMGGGMMGGMGGMGGGMGGMGGGMGGMGGGMMGGMGGMGGGMGGMGGGMGGMFDVEDVIQLGKPAKRESSTAVEKVIPTRIHVTPKDGESRDDAWNRYFTEVWATDATAEEERQSFADVRQTVRELSTEKELDEVIALIQAALRNGQYQPWMYQTLGMALQATDADKETIERALMSAIDLSQNADEIMMMAAYMGRIGLDHRAIQLFRDIATAFPLRPEPYIQALEAAQRIDDSEGIKWACRQILQQAWPEKHQPVFDKAVLVSKATIYDLEKAGKETEAREFADLLNQALSRDCIVRINWTGDADIDLMVEEPSGTVCSLHNPRTSGGGVMLGDAIANAAKQSADGISETYVCPQGFSGEYRVLIRRVWGDVAAGKVTVDVFTNVKTEKHDSTFQQHIRKQIDLREQDALVIFKLENGRRNEPLEDHLVANAAMRHVNVNRSILAQQFDVLAEPGVGSSNSLAELELLSRDPRNAVRINQLLRGRGAVGFRPVITTLPEGTMMMGQAVISADRRYVRFTVSPSFSRIGDVSTFNFATGDSQQQGGGGGNVGGGVGGGGVGGGGFGGGGGGLGGGGF